EPYRNLGGILRGEAIDIPLSS
ncbi:MAG: hypothetical protein QOC98_397, partial [Frankiaceae bacterium]|nr:hypothetical protein [Frankiaceae bacterium]